MLVAQLCPTLCDPMDYSLPGSSLHGNLQARILGWVAISFSRGFSQPRYQTQVSRFAGQFFPMWATRGQEGEIVSCGMWDLVPWPGIEPRPPALEAQSLSHWTTREVPGLFSWHLMSNSNARPWLSNPGMVPWPQFGILIWNRGPRPRFKIPEH